MMLNYWFGKLFNWLIFVGWIGCYYIDVVMSLGIYLYNKYVFKLMVEG